MSTPLTATHRMKMSYIVDGITHVAHAYCKRQDPLIGGPALANRDGTTLTDFIDAAQGWYDTFKEVLPNSVVSANVLLEERSGALWLPNASANPTGAGGAGTYSPASQLTLVLRDTAFKKIRVVAMETALGYIGHSTDGSGIVSNITDFSKAYNGVGLGPHDPYEWQKSRGDNYILATGAVAGATLDLNDKIKRSRGLE